MGTDPRPNVDSVLEFARIEFFEITKQQFQTRMLAIGIMGGVTPIFLSVLFPSKESSVSLAGITTIHVLVTILIALSFAYALLSVMYRNLSRRRAKVVATLESLEPIFLERLEWEERALTPYFRHKDIQNIQPLGRWKRLLKWVFDHIWTAINSVIFVLPCIGAMAISIYLYSTYSLPVWFLYVWIFFAVLNLTMFCVTLGAQIVFPIESWS